MIPTVHLSRKSTVSRDQESTRAFPLTEKNMPISDCSADSVNDIIEFLDVEKSERYKRTTKSTFCNIYAYDYAYLMEAFLPRVWWTERAIKIKDFDNVSYGKNVFEMNVNALYNWFPQYGALFGWCEVGTVSEAQKLANDGRCVVMLAANKVSSKSGHIVAIVPETDEMKAVGHDGIYIYPVMSQAGSTNKKRFNSKWWGGLEKIRIYYC